MKKVLGTGLVAGLAMVAGNIVLNSLMNAVLPQLQDEYMKNSIFRPWEDPIMMLFFLYPITLGFALSWVWSKTKHLFQGGALKRGINFGLVYFLVSGIPTFLINFSSFDLPIQMILSWTFMGAVNGMVAGIILAKLNK